MNTFDTPNSGTILNVDFWAMDNLIGLLKLVAEGRHYNTQVPIKYPNVAFDRIHHAERRPTLIKVWQQNENCGFLGLAETQACSCTNLYFFYFFFYPACLSLPTHHVLEFHFGNWLSMLHLSLAKVENSFPSLMECHSHFQSEADERERSGAPPGQNGFCMAGSQGLQRCRVTPSW